MPPCFQYHSKTKNPKCLLAVFCFLFLKHKISFSIFKINFKKQLTKQVFLFFCFLKSKTIFKNYRQTGPISLISLPYFSISFLFYFFSYCMCVCRSTHQKGAYKYHYPFFYKAKRDRLSCT